MQAESLKIGNLYIVKSDKETFTWTDTQGTVVEVPNNVILLYLGERVEHKYRSHIFLWDNYILPAYPPHDLRNIFEYDNT